MAGAGFKNWNNGDVLYSSDLNTYLGQQVVMVFANAAARTTALSGVLAEGMISYLKDTDAVEKYNGTSWIAMQPGDIEGVTATSPLTGGGTSGTVTIGIQDGTTAQKGAVQLSDSITTTSSTLAATSTAVKAAADASNNLTMVQQYTATESVLKNISSRVPAAEQLLKQAVYWIDAAQSDNSDQVLDNQGWAGSALPTQLGSSTSADSNDPKFLDFTGVNYVYLPGVASNYLSVPDAANLRITGDIDLRCQVAVDDWTPSTAQCFISKRLTNTNYQFDVRTSGVLGLTWYDTTAGAFRDKVSTVAPTVTDGSVLWVRVTLDVDNGASGNDVKFFTSSDGITWTQLGATVTTAGIATPQTGTDNVEIGSYYAGTGIPLAGKIFRAQIRNGIDGTQVLDVDTSIIGSGSATSFSALTGQTVTINRSTSGKKTAVVTHPVWLFGTDDYMEVNNRYMSSGTYLYLPGVSNNNASAPDSNALDVTGDIDIRMKLALDDWTPSAINLLLGKVANSTTDRQYQFYINTNGTIGFEWTPNGTSASLLTSTSSVAPTVTDGSTLWIRVTLDVDNGASGNDTIFYTSTDGTTWTQLGTTITKAGTTSIFAGTGSLRIGTLVDGLLPARGKFFRAQVLNGINGTVAFDANFETSITSLNQASFTESSANAATVTINRSGSAYCSAGITTAGYLYPGATNTFTASATDFLNFGASDSFTLVVATRLWANASGGFFIDNRNSGNTAGYAFLGNAGGYTNFAIYSGATSTSDASLNYTLGSLIVDAAVRNVTADNLTNYINAATNGSTTDTTTGSLVVTNGRYFIGSGGTALDGEIYALAVFRRVLTESEISTISTYYASRIGA